MSRLGQEWSKRTNHPDRGTLPKRMVRKVPQADYAVQIAALQLDPSFNYLITAGEQRRRHRDPQFFGGSQIELE